MNNFNRRLILASKSPRRSQLLSEAGFEFEIRTKDVEEIYPPDLPTTEVAQYLAELKADACADFLEQEDDILLAADSIVVLGDIIFGKPKDYDDAVHILEQLSGQMHEVITGVCICSKNKKIVFSGRAKVYFDVLTTEEIDFYVKNHQPYDKAGSYAIQEWIGLCKINKIEGTYSNIMGLPVDMVYRELLEF
ncbi:MAG: Maf family nucleotide pyrophosphatase [Saprospiraceae bacterium]